MSRHPYQPVETAGTAGWFRGRAARDASPELCHEASASVLRVMSAADPRIKTRSVELASE